VGSRNRDKRATKQKARDRRRGYGGGADSGTVDDHDAAEWVFAGPRWSPEVVAEAVLGLLLPDDPGLREEWVLALAAPPPADRDNVVRGLELALFRRFEVLWHNGWLPVDAVEHLRRSVPVTTLELARTAIARQVSRYARPSLHPRWWASVVEAEVRPDRAPQEPATRLWADRHALSPTDLLDAVLAILRPLHRIHALPTIVPAPGTDDARRAAREDPSTPGIDPKVLARVRALLAKAESTGFPEEAEALSAKAQDLMNRYSLEHALVEGEQAQQTAVITIRLWLDAPYVMPKTLLVQAIATANRCRSIAIDGTDIVSIVGHEDDLQAVQILVTSLLVQAGRAMTAEGRGSGGGGHARSRSFRQSFLVAYAGRIGERLQETAEGGTAEASDDRLLPVLAARASAVDAAVAGSFGEVSSKAVSGRDRAGQEAGRAAADAATLTLDRDRVEG
jgi:hypothetical protein